MAKVDYGQYTTQSQPHKRTKPGTRPNDTRRTTKRRQGGWYGEHLLQKRKAKADANQSA